MTPRPPDEPGALSEETLVERALLTLPRAQPPAGLADRAFAAAMRADKPAPLALLLRELFGELFGVARAAAAATGVVACALGGLAWTDAQTNAETASAVDAPQPVATTRLDTAWVAAVLPFTVDERTQP